MLESLELFFSTYGYFAVVAVLLLCGLGLPIPEDISLVAGGILSGLGKADLHLMILAGLLGVLSGDILMFYLGHRLGPKILKTSWGSRLITPERYQKVQKKFSQYGDGVIFITRFLPGLRTPVFVTTGMSHSISFIKFLTIDTLAASISVPVWVAAGHYGAENRVWLMRILSHFRVFLTLSAIFIITVLMVYWLCRRYKGCLLYTSPSPRD